MPPRRDTGKCRQFMTPPKTRKQQRLSASLETAPAEPVHLNGHTGDGGPVKHFVVDTNVLLHNPNALFVFKEHHVVIPFAVIEELDAMKKGNDDLGRNARETIRHLDRLRAQGSLTEGVAWGKFSPTVGAASSAGGN